MRKLLLPAMLVLLTVSLSLVVGAQEKMRDKKLVPPLQHDKAGVNVVKGKVTEANSTAKTVTISGPDGGRVTLDFANAKVGSCKITPNVAARVAPPKAPVSSAHTSFPKVGDSVVARADACSDCLETC